MQFVYTLTQKLHFLRRPLGLFCFGLALLGFVAPIIPGWPFIIPAVVLLGRRDRTLRYAHVLLRRTLRWLRRSRRRPLWLRAVGQRLSVEYLQLRRMITPQIMAAERMFAGK